MRPIISLTLVVAGLCLACGRSTASAQSPGMQSAAAVWVAHQGVASIRVGKGVVETQVERAGSLLLPVEHDPRFRLKGTSIRHLPHKNLIELTSEAEVSVTFVADKTASVTVQLRPEIDGDSLRLVLVRTRRSVSGCTLEGPICYMVRRAIDRHLADGRKLQAYLDEGLTVALRPVFRKAAGTACLERRLAPAHVKTAPEFLDILMAERTRDVACAPSAQPQPLEARHAAFKREDKVQKARAYRNVY